LWFQLMKGATVTIAGGTSAAYVPTRLLPRPSWPRTLKLARAALWTDSMETWRRRDYSVPDGAVSRAYGPQCIVDETSRVWKAVGEASSPPGLLALARAQLANPSTYDIHHPHPSFVAAFALARNGDLDASEQEIGLWAASRDHAELAASQRALELVANHARP
jgi:hypothetical protein